MINWQEVKLGYVCDLIAGFAFKSKDFGNYPDKVIKITNIEPPFVNTANLIGIDISKYNRDKLKKFSATKGDYVLAMTGATIGKLGRICEGKAYINQRVLMFKPTEAIDKKFLYYNLVDNKFMQYVLNHIDSESAQANISATTIGKYEFSIPSLGIQKQIAGVLGALDNKIELNNKVNNNLEQQAQALFKSWFVDFEPFGGKMPDDWKVGKLKNILKLKKDSIKRGENTSLPYLPIDIIPMHSLALTEFKPNKEAQSSLITFNKDDILIGAMRVYFHRVSIAPCAGITRTTCFVLSPLDKDYLIYALMICNQKESIEFAQTTSKGSTMPYAVWDGGLGELDIYIPPKIIISKFNNLLLPSIKKIQNSYFENTRLAQLRDTLLPKLMSGEIDVSNVNISADKSSFSGDK